MSKCAISPCPLRLKVDESTLASIQNASSNMNQKATGPNKHPLNIENCYIVLALLILSTTMVKTTIIINPA